MALLEIFSIDDNKQNFKSENDNDFDLPNIQSYVYTIELTRMFSKQTDAINSLNFSVLSHM